MRCLAVGCLAALALSTGCKRDVSGSYLADGKSAVYLLQLVRTPDNHVSGQIVTSILKPDGKIDRSSVSLSGAVNGENITLTASRLLGLETIAASGTYDGNSLTVTGVQPTPVTLTRANLAEYQAKIEEQTAQSREVISARTRADAQQRTLLAERKFVSDVDRMIGRMQEFDTQADVRLGRFPNAEKSYEAITAKVSWYVARERQLSGRPNRTSDRSQLFAAANHASVVTDQMHNQAQNLKSSLETDIAPLFYEVERNCHQTTWSDANLTPTEMQAHQAACDRFLNSSSRFREKHATMMAALSHLEDVYKREKSAQERLLAVAEKLV